MVRIMRSFGFDAGHRVLGHESKCANLHGHRYTAEVTCTASKLDDLGRIIDFSEIKRLVGAWVDEHWDHTMILHPDDPLWQLHNDKVWNVPDIFGPKTPFNLNMNPTAENLARVLYEKATELLAPAGIAVVSVKMWETPNCYAVYGE